MIKNGVDETSVEGAADSPYLTAIADHRVELHTPRTRRSPSLWWRSVGHSHTAFVIESFIDELAHAAGKDPLEYRRALLGAASARTARVLELAAEKAGWGKPLPAGRARGIAVHESFGSFVAQVAEVSVDEGRRSASTASSCAVDCGTGGQPATASRRRCEGGIVFGLSAALYGEITFEKGRVEQAQLPRLPDAAHERDAEGRGAHRAEHARRWAASASRACRRSRRPWPTRSSPSPASASARCRCGSPDRPDRSREAHAGLPDAVAQGHQIRLVVRADRRPGTGDGRAGVSWAVTDGVGGLRDTSCHLAKLRGVEPDQRLPAQRQLLASPFHESSLS